VGASEAALASPETEATLEDTQTFIAPPGPRMILVRELVIGVTFKDKAMIRIKAGGTLERRLVETVQGNPVEIPDKEKFTHLQFRRFAGCPMCNLHIRDFIRRHEELVDHGIREVVVFHSSKEALLKNQDQVPFDLIADPEKTLYREFGVETSVRSVLHPGAWLPAFKGVLSGRFSLPSWGESPLGLPADFLIDRNGQVAACKYGKHAYDHWTVDEVIEFVQKPAVSGGCV
jgi:hypothetical protein